MGKVNHKSNGYSLYLSQDSRDDYLFLCATKDCKYDQSCWTTQLDFINIRITFKTIKALSVKFRKVLNQIILMKFYFI